MWLLPILSCFSQQIDAQDYSNVWWQPSRAGQGVQILHRDGNIYGAWYLYGRDGAGDWVTFAGELAHGGQNDDDDDDDDNGGGADTLRAALLGFSGPALGAAWDQDQVASTVLGELNLRFESAAAATLDYTVDGVTDTLTLQVFDPEAEGAYTGVWWDPARNGQGVQLLHNGDVLSGAWYLYDEHGDALWVTFAGELSGDRIEAPLLRFAGPKLGGDWRPEQVRSTPVGSVSIRFVSARTATFAYALNGVRGELALVPYQPEPAARCAPQTPSDELGDYVYLSALYPAPLTSLRPGADPCAPAFGDADYDRQLTGAGFEPGEYESPEESYYYTVDPDGLRQTLDAWLALHGFTDAHGVTSPSVIRARYINAYDLGFGRDMSCLPDSRVGGHVYPCVVDNYDVGPDPDNPTAPTLIASVAMERVMRFWNGVRQYYTAFYVFGADGRRINSIDLDGSGPKRVPEVCWSCHDGESTPIGSRRGQYLAFDSELFRDFPGAPSVAAQQPALRELNAVIHAVAANTRGGLDTDAHSEVLALIEGWYGGDPAQTDAAGFDPEYTREITGGHGARARFYARYCRTCHVAQKNFDIGSGPFARMTFGEYLPDPAPTGFSFNCLLCHEATNAVTVDGVRGFNSRPQIDTSRAGNLQKVLCRRELPVIAIFPPPPAAFELPEPQMPNARVTHQRLLEENLDSGGNVIPDSLLDGLIGGGQLCDGAESLSVTPLR